MKGELPDNERLEDEVEFLKRRVKELEAEHLRVTRTLAETEARLTEREDNFRILMETIPEMVSHHRPDSTYVYVSPACTRLFGYLPEDLIGRKAYDFIHPEDVPIVRAAVQRVLETGGVESGEYRHLTKDGAYVWVGTTGRAIAGSQVDFICVVRDIAARKRMQEALQESEERFRLVAKHFSIFIYERDIQTGLAQIFGDIDRCLGYAHGGFPLTLAGWVESVHPDDLLRVLETNKKSALEDVPYDLEYRLRKADGGYLDWWDCGVIVRDMAGTPVASVGMAADITARKHLESNLHRTNRALVLINECNLALVRAGDEMELLQRICRLIWQFGGYPLVWIGYAQDDEKKTVRPVAWSGDDEYIVRVDVTWADVERGRGPMGTCIREQRPVFVQNTGTDDSFRPWRAAALERGYGSVISIPLVADGRAFGAMGLYASDTDAFNANEIGLLSRLAANMAYGIGLLRTRVERKRVAEALRESEENMRYIIKHDPNAIAIYDMNLCYIAVSDRYLADYNIIDSDILGKHHYDVFPEMPQRWKDVHQRCLAGAIEQNDDDYFERPDGSITYNRWECRPWYRANGKVGGMITYTEVTTERKKAELALRESEAMMRGILRAVPLGIGVARSRVMLWSNEQMLDMIGYTQDECRGRSLGMLWRSDAEFEYDAQRLGEGMNETGIGAIETRLVRKDGSCFEVHVLTACLDPLDPTSDVIAAISDITERKRTEDALRESEVRYRTLFNAGQDAIFLSPVKAGESPLNFTEVNQIACQVFGYTCEELLAMSPKDIVAPENHERMRGLDAKLIENGHFRAEWDDIAKDGHRIPVDVSVTLFELSGQPMIMAVVRDITEHTQVLSCLSELNTRYQTLFDNSPIALWEEDYSEVKRRVEKLRVSGVEDFQTYLETHPDEVRACVSAIRVLDLNRAAVDLHKAGNKQELLSNAHSLLAEETFPVFVKEFVAIAEGRTAINQFSPLKTMTGEIIRAMVRWTVPPGHETTLSRVLVAAIDVTDRVLAERQLIEHRNRLRLLAAKLVSAEEQGRRQLAVSLHDDVGQLLVLIKIKLGELDRLPLTDGAQVLVRETRESTVRVIERIRTITAELFPAVLHQFGLSAALEAAAEEIQHETGLPVAFLEDKAPMPLNEETSALLYRGAREALFNVVKHARAHRAQVSVQRVGNCIEVMVEDDGVGFDFAEAQSRIGKTKGLGLFLLEERLRYAGGLLTVDSAPGQGSRVMLRVPIEQPDAASLGETK